MECELDREREHQHERQYRSSQCLIEWFFEWFAQCLIERLKIIVFVIKPTYGRPGGPPNVTLTISFLRTRRIGVSID